MPRTPDAFDGERYEEAVIFEDEGVDPSQSGEVRHSNDDLKGFFNGRLFDLLRPASREETATNNITTTSTGFVTAAGMAITPPEGTYVAIFSTWGEHNNNSAQLAIGLAVDGADIAGSERRWGNTNQSDNIMATLATQKRITVDGTQQIQGRFRRNTGSGSVELNDRVLTLIEVADG